MAYTDEFGMWYDDNGNPIAAPAVPAAPTYDYSFNVLSNKGNPTGLVGVNADTPVALVNNRTGELVYSGTGVEAAKQIEQLASNLTSAGGNKATWSIYTAPAGATDTSQFTQAAYEKPNKSVLGTIADIGLPVLGTLLALPTGGLSLGAGLAGTLGSAAAAGAAGAAGGSLLSSALQGVGLEDALKKAALSGAGSYIGGSLLGPSTGGFNAAAADAAGKAAIDNIISQGMTNLYSGTAGSLLGSTAGDIVSTAILPSLLGTATGTAGGALAGDIVSTAQRPPSTGTTIGALAGALPTDIVSTAPKPTTDTGSTAGSTAGAAAGGAAGSGAGGGGNITATDLLTIAGLLAGGGGGSGATGAQRAYTGTMLRAPRSFNAADYAVTPYAGDYEKYGFGAAHNFYSPGYYGIVPQAATGSTNVTQQAASLL